jgi:hypothetical protein
MRFQRKREVEAESVLLTVSTGKWVFVMDSADRGD